MGNTNLIKTSKPTEKSTPIEKNIQLHDKVKKFLDILYRYDCVGKNAYYKKEPAFHKFQKTFYNMIVGKKYLWIDAPYLKLGVTAEGKLFWPKNYRQFQKNYVGLGHIDEFLDENQWGKNIRRVHTRAKRGLGLRYESAVKDYHKLWYSRPKMVLNKNETVSPKTKNSLQQNLRGGPKIVVVSDMINEMKSVLKNFIVGLGYTKKQGENFAEGYVGKLRSFPFVKKMLALTQEDGECMTSGFKAASIDEDEAFERHQKSKSA